MGHSPSPSATTTGRSEIKIYFYVFQEFEDLVLKKKRISSKITESFFYVVSGIEGKRIWRKKRIFEEEKDFQRKKRNTEVGLFFFVFLELKKKEFDEKENPRRKKGFLQGEGVR